MDVCRFAASLGNRCASTQVTPHNIRDVYRDELKMQIKVVLMRIVSFSVRQGSFYPAV
ncbi:hypothetical protein [Xenorhabdus sp. PB30.3]|uniref:hypothetical protein n=1 Tax=Xenorhabdus sp. PB30.3 TaxID=2788941 RepID=UPI001E4D1F32|nr:hypothetical protein [Xenorhabdus sp. PB30.3]MCC8380264.1 hypothetical protein [Xenorhabdus sp. PB30.3]